MNREWLNEVTRSMLGYRESAEATYDLARAVLERKVPGDFVEAGVYAGAHCAVMAKAMMDHEQANMTGCVQRVHLFDSFEGLPAATAADEELWAAHGDKLGESKCSLADVKENMRRWGIPEKLLVYHPGWFSETVSRAAGMFDVSGAEHRRDPRPLEAKLFDAALLVHRRIALLRLDADLYESTTPVMQYLYPLVSPGGWVIIDDFNLTGCRKAVMETVVPAPVYWRIPTK